MDAKTFLRDYGADEARMVAEGAGSNLPYFKQLASKHRIPSRKLAQRLAAASGGRLDVGSLLFPPGDDATTDVIPAARDSLGLGKPGSAQ